MKNENSESEKSESENIASQITLIIFGSIFLFLSLFSLLLIEIPSEIDLLQSILGILVTICLTIIWAAQLIAKEIRKLEYSNKNKK